MSKVLERTTFETSRLLEFFTEKELSMQIGHDRAWWPLAMVKELVDNALDACETAGTPPEIEVTVEADTLSVRDNGPGIPAATLERSLDYLVRVSDKQYYVSPTRGQLGNALKCVWAAPYVATGEQAHVEVLAGGLRHDVTVALNRIAQRPELSYNVAPDGVVKTGTFVKTHWPGIASYLDAAIVDQLLENFAAFNPHATFAWRCGGRNREIPRTDADWRKWRPGDPTSPHWYNVERLRALIAAYVTQEQQDGAKPRTVREFVSEFHGLSGTAKQKKVTVAAGLAGAWLHDLVDGGDVTLEKVETLLAAMQGESRPPKPMALGILGKQHLAEHMASYRHVSADSIQYKAVEGTTHGLPFVLEVAFGVYTEDFSDSERDVAVGLNWSPALKQPIRELLNLLGQQRVDPGDPVVVLVHLACPLMQFTDRGKGVLELLRGD